jgi:ABC-type transport system involved in multi-copper enzyme maturation permease subunit
MVSPAAVYQYLGEAIADAGFERQQRFLRAAENFHPVFENYVRSKLGKLSSIPPGSNISERITIDGKEITFHAGPPPYKGDLSDFPHFNEPEWSIIDSLRTSLNNLLILFLWNAVLFVAAHYVFVKRSLR